jgi:pseudolysin/vibriolysin
MSAQAATVTDINDYNITNYLKIGNKSLASEDNNYKFTLIKKIVLSNGVVKNKYALSYKDVPVYNSILSSSAIEGKQISWHGQMLTDIQEDIDNVTPSFDKPSVLDVAKNHFKPKKNDVINNESVSLYIRMNEFDKAELIYLVSFYVEGPRVQRPYYIINANTGKIISTWDGLTTRSAEGPGGNLKVGSYYYGRDFGFLDVSESCSMTNAGVDTYDMRNQTTGGSIYRFACPASPTERPVNNGRAVNGAFSPLNDGHYFAGMVLDMYKKWYSVDPLGRKMIVRVHFGSNYENAFWNGQQMTFGDGATRMYPLVSLDIMAHEVSHGVTEFNSGLVYRGQPGGINESFSDMAGETAEDYMNQQVGRDNDWLSGASIMKNVPAMRYFKDPKLDGASIDNAKDYNDSLDVHHSSGVFNKAFYLLATKPTWDIRKAFSVFLAANQVYWQPESNFNNAACGVAKAGADLGYEVGDIITSFKEVGVDANCNIPDPQPDPSDELEILNGTIISNINMKKADEHRYLIKVPVVRTFPYTYDILSIRVYNNTGNAKNSAQLYVRYEDGSLKAMDKTVNLANGDEVFNIKKPASGNYHILIKGINTGVVNLNAFYGNFSQ